MAPRILFVDDEEDLCTLVQCHLSLQGYTVDVAADGLAALDKLISTTYDLVFLDMHMPSMGGEALVAELRRRNIPARLILVTGDGSEEARALSASLGAIDFLPKPFHFRQLLESITRALS